MAGIFHSPVALRTLLKRLSPHSTLYSVTGRTLVPGLSGPVLRSKHLQCRVWAREHHAGADRAQPSPAAAPERLPFSRVTPEDVAFFREILQGRAVTDPDLLAASNMDWLKSVRGKWKKIEFRRQLDPLKVLFSIYVFDYASRTQLQSYSILMSP